ncbi:hypothetical protein BC936DRAFT_146740 [Jimgerdemannia flammicorona]|uniref:SET domain-containing protein n=1 Tax=Jimgerdemannia flammicorona TaxID=994334 RepID=A0A433D6Y7_9FUNG|nr:hypothetical protein BC936DRAFT_146740 [Jimgerdemannia flammicorona]
MPAYTRTIVNKDNFTDATELKDLDNVGRSLVAIRDLKPGDVVLREKPLLQYLLRPTCRSSLSPYYSKRLWNEIVVIVLDEEKHVSDKVADAKSVIQFPGADIENGDGKNENDVANERGTDDQSILTESNSSFCPGVPASMLAYLEISPPPYWHPIKSTKQLPTKNELDFFYFPDPSDDHTWSTHPTITLIHNVCRRAIDTIREFSHLLPADLSCFVLKIYSNAHTVALTHTRTVPTHPHRRDRRDRAAANLSDAASDHNVWGSAGFATHIRPTIALMSWSSKFAHSCTPNMFARFNPTTGELVFTIVRPLSSGDLLEASYLPEDDAVIGGLICGSTESRRDRLWSYKFFLCRCARCEAWDRSRGMACPSCAPESAIVLRRGGLCPGNSTDLNPTPWRCLRCREFFPLTAFPFITSGQERRVESVLMAFSAELRDQKPRPSVTQMMETYLVGMLAERDPQRTIPQGHWTYAQIHLLLALYHLRVFPGYFGRALAMSTGKIERGLEEAVVYLRWLDGVVWVGRENGEGGAGNAMAAFFAGWKIAKEMIWMVDEEIAVKKVVVITDEKDDVASDSDYVTGGTTTPSLSANITTTPAADPSQEQILRPLPASWALHVEYLETIIRDRWLPLLRDVFGEGPGVVTSGEAQDEAVVHEIAMGEMVPFLEKMRKVKGLR